MQFAVKGIRFDAFLDYPEAFYYGGMIASKEDGTSCCFWITDYCYEVTPRNAVIAGNAFLNEMPATKFHTIKLDDHKEG